MRIATAAIIALLALPSAAGADVIHAETALPPGQSGFVSVAGLASGTGSPHLYDQQSLFTGFHWKSALFDQPGATENPRPGVSIVRDGYGVPAVTADNVHDMWWGAGYALAEDRLFELELFRHATTGTLAEVGGESRVGDDAIVRQDLYRPGEVDEMFGRLPADQQDLFAAYADGINAWITHVNANPADLPGEYPATGSLPAPWTVHDSAAIGIYLARTIPTNADPEELELANLKAVKLSGPKVLKALVPLRTPGSVTTIPGKRFPSQPGRTRADERAGLTRSVKLARTLPFPTATVDGTSVQSRRLLGPGGSYMFALRRRSDGHALLFNGPQLGFTAPEKLVEIELHSPGVDLRGMTAPGVPVIGAGTNGHVAWGVTTGASDTSDLYAERLVPGHPEQYMYRGQVRDMDCETQTITFHDPPSGLLSTSHPAPPVSGSEDRRFCRTIHGPVEARAGDVAYARRYATWGRELETLAGLTQLSQATDIHGVDAAMRKVTWNENLMAADSAGNIGFWHPGLFPLRAKDYDERLPLPGTGAAEWRGLLPRSRIPAVINPKQGWLANWNNLPAKGWTSGDGTARKRLDGPFFRAHFLFGFVRELAKHPSFEGMQDVIRHVSTVAQQFPQTRQRLKAAARGATGNAKTVLDTLLAWDGSFDETAADGTVDAGLAAWTAFLAAAARTAVEPLGPGARWLAGEDALNGFHPGYHAGAPYHYFDATHEQSYGLSHLGASGYRTAAAAAFDALQAKYGSGDPAAWRQPRPLYDFQGLAGESPPDPLPFFERGTYEEFFELGS